MSDNPSFVMKGIDDVAIEQRSVPEIQSDNDVLVEVRKTGICGSDVHYLVKGRIGDFIVKKPMVLGHESAGVISKVGKNVTSLKPGDRVAVEPGATCGHCDVCKVGRYNLCLNIVFAATPPDDGTLCRYYRVPHHVCYKLPDHLTLEDGAMMEPLSVGVHAVANLGAFRTNQSIAVFGCGPVGLLAMAVAKALGARRVIAVDIVPSRLEVAKAYAATDVYQPPKMDEGETKQKYSERAAAAMREALKIQDRGDASVDLVVDASGAEVSIQQSFFVVKSGGTVVQVGMGNPNVSVDIGQITCKELTYKGSFRYGPGDYPLAIALVSQGKIDLKPLVTHRYPFNDAIAAFEATKAGKGKDGKGVIKAIISGPDVSVDSK